MDIAAGPGTRTQTGNNKNARTESSHAPRELIWACQSKYWRAQLCLYALHRRSSFPPASTIRESLEYLEDRS